jgi:hypothetical protein
VWRQALLNDTTRPKSATAACNYYAAHAVCNGILILLCKLLCRSHEGRSSPNFYAATTPPILPVARLGPWLWRLAGCQVVVPSRRQLPTRPLSPEMDWDARLNAAGNAAIGTLIPCASHHSHGKLGGAMWLWALEQQTERIKSLRPSLLPNPHLYCYYELRAPNTAQPGCALIHCVMLHYDHFRAP